MPKVTFQNNKFDTEHEAACAALFNRYGWRWERPRHPFGGWVPDFVLKGNTSVYVECKAGLKWDHVQSHDLTKYEDAVSGSSDEVLLIPYAPKVMEIAKGYRDSVLGLLFDGNMWGYAELGVWSERVGFCHKANSWRDRMSGENVPNSVGDGSKPNVDLDWRAAQLDVQGKRKSFFKASVNAEIEEWEPSSE
jgi:hypothetical protein